MDRQTATKIAFSVDKVLHEIGLLLDIVNASCEGDVRKRFLKAIGIAIGELDLEVLETIYREFPELRPKGMEKIHGRK